ncbi:polysaccharide pyruvyl transferase family protein [Pseudarthrobacter sp. AB1]|uniref:polysaccharide pyruvyl transferase family protein n=1 Tax=Pseudarthrobacter sp. AB1 TaxID=2138309 RepID=UPI00186BAE52|nr:polysaccharide pyruvyl transferase family protein [Pseudarthrobacter sp. AB1]
MKKRIAGILITIFESRSYLCLSRMVDEVTLVFFKQIKAKGARSKEFSIVVPTIGNGNLGDQAMFDSFLTNVTGNIVAVVNSDSDLKISDLFKSRVSMVPLRGLLSGWPLGRIRARMRFLELLQNASSLSVVGADIMDGGYSRRDSVLRSQLLMMAGSLDVPSQILGFSWNGRANSIAQRALERVSKRTILNLRDPISFERIQSTACENTVLSADTVFALQDRLPAGEAKDWVDSQERCGRRIAVINTSGLLARRFDLDSEYRYITKALLGDGYSVVILPHVIRKGDDDLAAAVRLKEAYPGEDVFLVDRLWSPENVAWLASKASVVVTGRMHLAILSLGQGTPAITLASQGKVEGMLRFFELEKYAVEPRVGMADDIVRLIEFIQFDDAARRDEILSRLQVVVLDARKNFALTEEFPALQS